MTPTPTDRAAAARLGADAAAGRVPAAALTTAARDMPRDLVLVALAAYALERQMTGGPTGYPRTSKATARRHHAAPACHPRDQWNATTPYRWPTA